MKSLFTPLKSEGLTSLKLRYDYREDKILLFAAKLWEQQLDFSKYNMEFYVDSLLTPDACYLNDSQVRAMFDKNGLAEYLAEVSDLLRKGKHFGIDCYFNEKFNIRFMGHIHSRRLGVNNKYHATLAGGIRRHGFEDDEIDVIIDGLNLSRAMSFKNIAAGINFGGSKTTVHMEPLDLDNAEVMGFLAYALDSLRTMTGPDMNFPTAMSDVMNKSFSLQFTGGPNSKLGETGRPTAYGTYLALKQALKFKTGNESAASLKIAVQGLGSVGWYLAEHLAEEGAELIVTDVDKTRAEQFIAQFPGKKITYVPPDNILELEVDVLCPCAVGGIIHDDNIANFKCGVIFGGANNQLRASSEEEEIRLAKLLAQRGILFQEAWWHNSAGVMAGAEEYVCGEDASYDTLLKKIEDTVPHKTWENLIRSKELGITPTECMYQICREILYGLRN